MHQGYIFTCIRAVVSSAKQHDYHLVKLWTKGRWEIHKSILVIRRTTIPHMIPNISYCICFIARRLNCWYLRDARGIDKSSVLRVVSLRKSQRKCILTFSKCILAFQTRRFLAEYKILRKFQELPVSIKFWEIFNKHGLRKILSNSACEQHFWLTDSRAF